MAKLFSIETSLLCAGLLYSVLAQAQDKTFQFKSIGSLDEMKAMIRDRFQLGSPRDSVRTLFVSEGHASFRQHPTQTGVEKYIYDINLCSYYVWRWNLSADFDPNGKLAQLYVNGDIVFADGTPKRSLPKVATEGTKASIYKMQRLRPETAKGESSLGYILVDLDSNPATRGDQAVMGAGPSRPDPLNFGKMIVYSQVDPWRSIFDSDPADRIVPYAGDCSAVDERARAISSGSKK